MDPKEKTKRDNTGAAFERMVDSIFRDPPPEEPREEERREEEETSG